MHLAAVNPDGSVYLGADMKYFADNGRASVRIESKKRYEPGLYVWDVAHMPTGCGTWPTLGGGELNVRTDGSRTSEFRRVPLLGIVC